MARLLNVRLSRPGTAGLPEPAGYRRSFSSRSSPGPATPPSPVDLIPDDRPGSRSAAIPIDTPLPSAPARLSTLTRSSIDVPGGRIDVVHPRGAMELLYEQNFDAHEEYPPYWAQLWPSSVALARAVAAAAPAGARVLELGCGLGLPSIAAALGGARVLATDRSTDALGFTAYNAALNEVSVEVGVCSWANPEPVPSRGPWDLVLAADVLYLHGGLADLGDLLPRLVDGTGEVWLADPGRPPAAAFLDSCTGWAAIDRVPSTDPDVTVHRFRPREPRSGERNGPAGR